MVTRNDDPPTDRAAEEAEALYDKIFEEVCDLKPECLANALRAITDYVLKKIGESYTDGYVDGRSAEAEAAEEAHDNKAEGHP